MAKIVIKNLNNRVLHAPYNNSSKVLNIIQEHNIDWMHACGGNGRCTTCKFKVLDGWEQLSAPTAVELRFRKLGQLTAQERLACQCQVLGDILIKVPAEGKFPHMAYSD